MASKNPMSKNPTSKNNAAELRTKTADELSTILVDLKREQFNLRFQRATGQQEGTARVREVRREIARVKTLQHASAASASQTSPKTS